MKRKNWFVIALILIGAILFGIISFTVIRSNRTVNAVVPSSTIAAGETVTPDMLTVVQVPVNTPTGYITDRSTLIGHRLKVTVAKGQLLYMSDVMVSWDDVVYGVSVPDDYIITTINIPNDRAVGGLITVGDTVDILGVPTATSAGNTSIDMQRYLGKMAEHSYGADGIHVYWILANVKILQTDSSLSSKDDSLLSSITEESGNSKGSYYVVALSYSDYMKLILAQQYLDLWMNISPVWNNNNPPLLDVMQYSEIQDLLDSQAQSIIEEIEGKNDGEVVKRIKPKAQEDLEALKKNWMEKNNYQYVTDGLQTQESQEQAQP